ncbi:MAG: hypothetical protein ACKO3P_02385, partial [Planctomycetaceae bacterium]
MPIAWGLHWPETLACGGWEGPGVANELLAQGLPDPSEPGGVRGSPKNNCQWQVAGMIAAEAILCGAIVSRGDSPAIG